MFNYHDTDKSMLLDVCIMNTMSQLRKVLPDYSAGKLNKSHHPHAMGVLYRKLGVCRMLNQQKHEPLFIAQMQSTAAYLVRLPLLPEDDKVTSRAAVFYDAIGGEYWEEAAEIVKYSRARWHPVWEHEDDFLYVWFLMTRYFFTSIARDTKSEGELAWQQSQHDVLERWKFVLDGAHDSRFLLCSALVHRDATIFSQALDEMAEARATKIKADLESRVIHEEDAFWVSSFWGEGLALLRLAERDNLLTGKQCSMVPTIIRLPNPYSYDASAWMTVDFNPAHRRGQ